MADISSLSNEELLALGSGAPPLTIYANRKLQSLSDEDLLALSKGNAPTQPMGSDGVAGDEIRARNAGNTRPQMRLPDISAAYDAAAGNRPEQQAMAQAYVQRERADSPKLMAASDTVRQFAKGVPVIGGVADEVNAGISSLTGGDSYQKALDYQRARDTTFETAHPYVSTGLQAAGGVASGLGVAGKVAPLVSGASRAAILGTGFGGGATLGAADGFTRGEGLDDRLQQAAIGGALGGTIGAAAPVVAKGISKGAQTLLDAVTANRQVGRLGLDRPSADVLSRILSADGTLGPQGAANIARGGEGAMLADAGRNAAGVLDVTIQRGGPGATLASRAISDRASAAGKTVTQALDASLGAPQGLQTAETAIRDGSKAARSSGYKAAYGSPVNYADPTGMAIEDALKRVPGDIIGKANRLMQLNGEKSAQILANIADDGSVTYHQMPDVRQLDYITRALNQAAKSGEGQGALGGQTPLGAAYENLSRGIRDLVKQNVPEYAAALNVAREPIQQREALQFGSKLLSSGVTRDEVAHTVKGMSAPQLEAVKQGIRSQIDDAVANVSRIMSDPNLDAREATKGLKELSSRAAREKVTAVIGDGPAKALFGKLDEATRAFELRAATAENSKTFARTAIKETTSDIAEPGPVGKLMNGEPVKAAKSLVQALMGTGKAAGAAREDAIYGKLAQALTGPRGKDAEDFILKLQQASQRSAANEKLARALGLSSSGAISGGAYPAIYQQTK